MRSFEFHLLINTARIAGGQFVERVKVRSGSDAALILGDAIGNHHVAFARPEWISGADQDGALAAKTRAALFDRITTDKLAVAGFHLPGGGMGQVDTSDGGFVFVPEAG